MERTQYRVDWDWGYELLLRLLGARLCEARQFLTTTSGAIVATILPTDLGGDPKTKPPNRVFISADQLRADALG